MGIHVQVLYKRFVLDTVLSWLGFDPESLPYWLRDKGVNNISLLRHLFEIRAEHGSFYQAIMSVDKELYESTSLDGAKNGTGSIILFCPA